MKEEKGKAAMRRETKRGEGRVRNKEDKKRERENRREKGLWIKKGDLIKIKIFMQNER